MELSEGELYMRQKHIVIIMADQLRSDLLGDDTPNIRKIAEEGIDFTRAYTASPLCVPARGAFFTGTYPNVNGSIINPWFHLDAVHGDVKNDFPNMYRMMEGDWDSWHCGKQHLYTQGGKMENDNETKTNWYAHGATYDAYIEEQQLTKPGGVDYRGRVPEMALGEFTRVKEYSIPKTGCYESGFDAFFDGYYANQAVDAIKNRNHEKPLLLNAMFLAPHPPLQIPEPWYSMYEDVEMPDNVGQWYQDQSPLQMYNLTGVIGSRYSREDWKKIWPVYKGLVSLLDHCVGMIIDTLKDQGIYDDTMIIFTSDHGEMLGSHGLWQKMCMYEEAVRTPLFIKFPKDTGLHSQKINQVVSSVDVLPTICDYLEIETPDTLSGVSLMPTLAGKTLNREMIYIQFDGNGARSNFQRCAIMGQYKLIVDIFKGEIFLELYNVVEDPQEKKNLAFDKAYEVITKKMVASIRTHMSETGDLLVLPDKTYIKFIQNYSQVRKKRV